MQLLALGRQDQEDFEANLLYIMRLGLTWTIRSFLKLGRKDGADLQAQHSGSQSKEDSQEFKDSLRYKLRPCFERK